MCLDLKIRYLIEDLVLLEKCKIRSSPSEVTVPFDPREGRAEGPPFQPSFAGGAREARDPALDLIPDRI